ncbi:MAG: hypothetical protein ACRET5_00680 [Steroidobacteraceae bacterium]
MAIAVAGCGQATGSAVNVSGHRLMVYISSQAGGGQAAADVVHAERLAFAQAGGAKIATFTLGVKVLDKPTVSDDARAAIEDKTAIAYLGEIEPGTSQVSVQITNQLDLLQVSPTDTAVYLTQPTSAVGGAPGRWYPSGSSYHQTFARVVPTTKQEAAAIVAKLQALNVSKLHLLSDGQPYGASLTAAIRADAPAKGVTLAPAAAGAGAVLYAGNSASAATRALDRAAAASPTAKLFAPSALYSDAFVAGLSAAAQANLYVSSPGFTAGKRNAAAKRFESSFDSTYGHDPAPEAIFGYEAMAAVLAVLREAGSHANDRAVVVKDFLALKDRQSVLGTYSLHGGDTSLAPFVFARVQGGRLVVAG